MIEFKKNDPQVSNLVRLCYPSYKGRRTIKVDKRETYRLRDYWDGGSRYHAEFVHLPTNRLVQLEQLDYEHQKASNPFNLSIGKIKLTPDIAVVENVIFCGKDLGVRVYVHPDTFAEKFNK
ncbi:hypothetical protein LCGC14_2146660 [marine sediment metagenome]|uniref:Uncharacterized protein n=1 Tax=marine sediment metagenome TaxID=412755 RepID=A0A0F9EJ19_9ZZZZ